MSSPFPMPIASPFPLLNPTQTQQTGQSPIPLLPTPGGQPQAPIFAPSPLSQLISSTIINNTTNGSTSIAVQQNNTSAGMGTGLTPAPNNNVNGTTPNFNMGITPNTSALLASVGLSVGGNTGNANGTTQHGQTGTSRAGLLAGLDEMESMLTRIEGILEEITEIEGRVFEGMKKGDEQRLIALHTEYSQTLQNILSISSTNLTSSLPIIPASYFTPPPSMPTDGTAVQPNSQNNLTISDLAKWSEDKASMEFSKRENLRAGGKAVLDILRASASGR
ncbi:hypothetical protein I302_101857 [Kwoniella bestiolae CBS 10118]|uniref:Uncharacterized protein n=1 Tax=Kwoniella bestiolae CBS 10118 TaxID=1296100 RepID=A0A1B9GDF4_9TREE|nr:hypothetical protein I302_00536 [Kwoniella bestiolae CBS 10118]OCF29045.1 hypothetical protein I302_00536 [Kwoniella bestiolae CBS 10118]